MRHLFDVAWRLVATFLAVACAQGTPWPYDPLRGGSGGSGGSGSIAGSTGSAGTSAMKTPCNIGERANCFCADGIQIGMQSCKADPLAPTHGWFGPCEMCTAPLPQTGAASGAGG
jgi:hypothetical protein